MIDVIIVFALPVLVVLGFALLILFCCFWRKLTTCMESRVEKTDDSIEARKRFKG